jgi:hypothetical protein
MTNKEYQKAVAKRKSKEVPAIIRREVNALIKAAKRIGCIDVAVVYSLQHQFGGRQSGGHSIGSPLFNKLMKRAGCSVIDELAKHEA